MPRNIRRIIIFLLLLIVSFNKTLNISAQGLYTLYVKNTAPFIPSNRADFTILKTNNNDSIYLNNPLSISEILEKRGYHSYNSKTKHQALRRILLHSSEAKDKATFYCYYRIFSDYFQKERDEESWLFCKALKIKVEASQGYTKSAISEGLKALEERANVGNNLWEIAIYENIAYAYEQSFQPEEALKWYTKAEDFLNKKNNAYENQNTYNKPNEGDPSKYDNSSDYKLKLIKLLLKKTTCLKTYSYYDEVITEINKINTLVKQYPENLKHAAAFKTSLPDIERINFDYQCDLNHPIEAKKHLDALSKLLKKSSQRDHQYILAYSLTSYYLRFGSNAETSKYLKELTRHTAHVTKDKQIKILELQTAYAKKINHYKAACSSMNKLIQLKKTYRKRLFDAQINQLKVYYQDPVLEKGNQFQQIKVNSLRRLNFFLILSCSLLVIMLIIFITLYKTLHKAKIEAEEANKQTEKFLVNTLHSIKNSLDELSSYARQLPFCPGKDSRRWLANKVTQGNFELQQSLFAILDYSKIESGNMKFSNKNINLFDLYREIETEVNENRIYKLKCSFISTNDRLFIHSDRGRLKQLIITVLTYINYKLDNTTIKFGYKKRGDVITLFAFRYIPLEEVNEIKNRIDNLAIRMNILNRQDLEMLTSLELLKQWNSTLEIIPQKNENTFFQFKLTQKEVLP